MTFYSDFSQIFQLEYLHTYIRALKESELCCSVNTFLTVRERTKNNLCKCYRNPNNDGNSQTSPLPIFLRDATRLYTGYFFLTVCTSCKGHLNSQLIPITVIISEVARFKEWGEQKWDFADIPLEVCKGQSLQIYYLQGLMSLKMVSELPFTKTYNKKSPIG